MFHFLLEIGFVTIIDKSYFLFIAIAPLATATAMRQQKNYSYLYATQQNDHKFLFTLLL